MGYGAIGQVLPIHFQESRDLLCDMDLDLNRFPGLCKKRAASSGSLRVRRGERTASAKLNVRH
jgi:hypothetical protein